MPQAELCQSHPQEFAAAAVVKSTLPAMTLQAIRKKIVCAHDALALLLQPAFSARLSAA